MVAQLNFFSGETVMKQTFNFKITNITEMGNVFRHIQSLDLSKKWEVICKPYVKDRTIAQNKLAFKWYKERGEQNGNGAHYERLFCKFVYGCGLMIEQEAESNESAFTEFYSKMIERYTFEECVDSMNFVEVTSLFKVKTFASYLNTIEIESVNQGIELSHPDDLYFESLMKYAEGKQ